MAEHDQEIKDNELPEGLSALELPIGLEQRRFRPLDLPYGSDVVEGLNQVLREISRQGADIISIISTPVHAFDSSGKGIKQMGHFAIIRKPASRSSQD